ncbi:hypothetical protein BVG19_g4016 [[Candida] boidinii]|nr:hypothetical protein BVG19_g4016 [[Candida] boidinii]OWB52814.1 hypothetical protein B5S27_g4396 [[Candida] boidinii]OWB67538.1 hypothetical protein B5S30_g2899 [[Candida] boidinii]
MEDSYNGYRIGDSIELDEDLNLAPFSQSSSINKINYDRSTENDFEIDDYEEEDNERGNTTEHYNENIHLNGKNSSREANNNDQDDEDDDEFKENDYIPFIRSSGILGTEYRVIHWQGHQIIEETDDVTKSWKLRFQLLNAFLAFTVLGLADQTLGSVMHYIMEEYKVDRAQFSALFLVQAFGYIGSSFTMNFMNSRLGVYGTFNISLVAGIAYCILFFLKPPFALLVFNALFCGVSAGLQDSSLNLFVGNLKYSNQILGLMHACYGLGCFISPLLATYLIHKGLKWNQYFLLICCVLIVALGMSVILFKNETQYKFKYSEVKNSTDVDADSGLAGDAFSADEEELTTFKCISNKYIQFFAFVLFVYIGSEFALGSWIYNYYITIKNRTDTVASYVTSTYWLFMTGGRVVLAFITGKYFEDREYKAIVLYCGGVSIGCLGFTIFHEFFILQIMSVSFVGFCVGPIFATTIIIAIKTLPKKYSNMGVGIIAGIGGSGAAVVSSLIGWISENIGGGKGQGLIYYPFTIFVSFSLATISWALFYFFNNKRLSMQYNKKYQALSIDS